MTKAREIVEECFPVSLNGVCLKPLAKSLKLINSKWMIFTLMAVPPNSTPVRYSGVRNRVKRIIERKQFNEIPLRDKYKELKIFDFLKILSFS